jgi:hypothetical protein
MADDEKKIIIDEGWKAQVQREKEDAAKKAAEEAQQPAEEKQPAEASLEGLVSGLAMQAMMALGVLGQRDAKEVMVDLVGAKYMIEMLLVLRDKTAGNLTPEEQGYMTETLADLQQTFVIRAQQVQEATLRGVGPLLNPEQ